MIRTFETHRVRPQRELTGSLWEFIPCQGALAGQSFQMATPCCWENHPEFVNYRGEGIFRTKFRAGGTLRLEFKGVSHTAAVFLDGKQIASHYNAYTIFDAVVKDAAEGEHVLEVRADNRFSKESALHIPNDYMSYGGISRPVVLEQLQGTYIKWIHVTPHREGEGWRTDLALALANVSGKTQTVLPGAVVAGRRVCWEETELQPVEEAVLRTSAYFSQVESWDTEQPRLYEAEAYLICEGKKTDDLIDRFGFREISIAGREILLNGRPLRIRGFCRHEDHPQFGCALPYEAMAADLALVRHLGGNSVRAVHYPHDERFLDLCDEQGILVWEENHARGLSLEDMQNPSFEPQAEQVIREMIPAHYNHPCIYIWGILNECASDTEYGKQCYEKQFALVRALDASRPVSFASCKFKTDLCFGLPSVVSYNIYPRWYHDTPAGEYLRGLYDWVQEETEGAGKPFLVTEIGAGAIYGCRTPRRAKWSEEYQADALEEQIRAVLDQPGCSGLYIWQLCDVRISDEWFAGRPRTMNNKGVLDEYRRPKLAYETVRRLYDQASTVKENKNS